MRLLRPVLAALFATTTAAVIACSSAPDESSSNGQSELVINLPCWETQPPLGCSVSPARDHYATDPGKTLIWSFNCQPPQNYDVPTPPCCLHPDGGVDHEFFTICPKSAALDAWIANTASTQPMLRMMGIHENPNVCSKCLPPAASGKVYVLWTEGEHIDPTCSGGCPSGKGTW